VRCSPGGSPIDLIPRTFNARSRVHEYGGGAYSIHNGSLFFSNFKDQRLYRMDSERPVPITPEPASPSALRYADGRVTPDGRIIISVRERHSEGHEPINEIVTIPTDGSAPPSVILGGYDFYSFPRVSADGKKLAWTCWSHPRMPWDGTELWVGDLRSDGSLVNSRLVAGSSSESIFQPEWSPDGSLYFISDRTGWWNLYVEQSGGILPVLETNAEIGVPQWVFGYSRYTFLSEDRIACVVQKNGFEHIVVAHTRSNRRDALPLPYSVFSSLVSDGADTLFFISASGRTAPEVVSFNLRKNTSTVLKQSMTTAIAPEYFSEPEPIEFPTSGNLTAYALFYPPRNKDFHAPEVEKPPLLVISHGGPTSATTPALKLTIQYWTSRGFAV